MHTKTLLVLVLSASALVGCESMGPHEGTGSLVGAAAGGLLGSQFGHGSGGAAMTALGAVGGLLLGREIGRSMDQVDRMKQQRAATHALETLPSGTGAKWRNPDTGHYGEITPTRTYKRADGSYCREFTQMVNVGGQTTQAYGTACRQPDGTWKIVS